MCDDIQWALCIIGLCLLLYISYLNIRTVQMKGNLVTAYVTDPSSQATLALLNKQKNTLNAAFYSVNPPVDAANNKIELARKAYNRQYVVNELYKAATGAPPVDLLKDTVTEYYNAYNELNKAMPALYNNRYDYNQTVDSIAFINTKLSYSSSMDRLYNGLNSYTSTEIDDAKKLYNEAVLAYNANPVDALMLNKNKALYNLVDVIRSTKTLSADQVAMIKNVDDNNNAYMTVMRAYLAKYEKPPVYKPIEVPPLVPPVVSTAKASPSWIPTAVTSVMTQLAKTFPNMSAADKNTISKLLPNIINNLTADEQNVFGKLYANLTPVQLRYISKIPTLPPILQFMTIASLSVVKNIPRYN